VTNDEHEPWTVTPESDDAEITEASPDPSQPVSGARLGAGYPPADPSTSAELRQAIEAIVLVATEPVPLELLAQLLERPQTEIEQLCDDLAEEYRARGSGFELVHVAGGYRYQSVAATAPYVERFILDEQRARLSGAALETLAIVAYKQPISRAQIASIRGVDPDGVLRTLSARGYIAEVGRDDGPGQAVLFGTTALFCEKLGLSSLDELPSIAEFIPEASIVEALEAGLRIDPMGTDGPAARP
jgi:segregation and condensation protein B